MAGFVQGIFLAPEGGAEMKSVQAATALEGCGLEGDRYCAGTGHWSRFGRVCEVTFIAAEDLDDIERETGVGVKIGEHRRNVVTRGISLKALRRGERFRVVVESARALSKTARSGWATRLRSIHYRPR
jgi:MOSC domain-containing protein YiiM